ncbi:MAG: histidinol-phosphatase [Bacilli bacterium]|nr:histidinol-phosphatase [Bacilli bacterium]
MLKYNYHTHTFLCHHATGTISDYLNFAYENGFKEIAMTDHLPFKDGRLNRSRMDYNYLNQYLIDVTNLKNNYPNMNILKGFECEFFPDLVDYYYHLKQKCDILVLGQHAVYDHQGQVKFIDQLDIDEAFEKYYSYIEQALKTNLFAYLAHPDLFLMNQPKFDEKLKNYSRKLLTMLSSYNTIIELNANGYKRVVKENTISYPNYDFWKLVKEEFPNLKIIINADAHSPHSLNDDCVQKCFNLAKELDLNLIEHL